MHKPTRHVKTPHGRFVVAGLLICVCIASAALWLRPERPELNSAGYDLAVALYQVCNQRSDEGLAKIETVVRAYREDAGPPMDPVFDRILRTAKSGDWPTASRLCRKVLDDQVRH